MFERSARWFILMGLAIGCETGRQVQEIEPSPRPATAPTTRPTTRAGSRYPVPYGHVRRAEIMAVLERVHGHLDRTLVGRIIHSRSREEITDFSEPAPDAIFAAGPANGYEFVSYPTGVTHAGMLLAGEVTGDARYRDFVASRLQYVHDKIPYFRAQADAFGMNRNGLRKMFAPRALDDAGAMCAALVKARRADVGPDLSEAIDTWSDFVATKKYRMPDGQLTRHRPQRESVWADDMYMSIPALAQMGALSGDRKWFDDAAHQNLGFARYLFNRDKGIFMHGRNMNQPDNPEFYWARANGWAMMATVELLSVLPEDHPRRDEVLGLLRAHIKGIAPLQSADGLWHNMLDKPQTYTETSATAMFVYSIARAINRGWISPVGYGAVAQAGWIGLSTRVNENGEVEGTCVATTFANDNVYYMNRPTSRHAAHGYGPMLLAGAEMIRLLENPGITIQYPPGGAIHYVPKAPATTQSADD